MSQPSEPNSSNSTQENLQRSRKNPTLRKNLLILTLLAGCGTVFYALLFRLEMMAPPRLLPAVLCLTSCKPDQSIHSANTTSVEPEPRPIADLLEESFEKEKISILVEKSAYQLTVFYDSEPIKTYPVVFGGAPTGDKLAEGDRKTPEGIYRIRDLYPHPEWSKFIWLDYPTPQDWQEHSQAKLTGEISPTATIGSEIGIHGVPEGADGLIDSRNNWTWGCVSLKNSDVDEIYDVVTQGTIIEIIP